VTQQECDIGKDQARSPHRGEEAEVPCGMNPASLSMEFMWILSGDGSKITPAIGIIFYLPVITGNKTARTR
jgi:hypothetical protein